MKLFCGQYVALMTRSECINVQDTATNDLPISTLPLKLDVGQV